MSAPSLPAKRRIFIADDHPMTRHGVVQLINSEPDLVVCGESGSAEQARALVEASLPDLILADISMPGKSGLDLIRDLLALHPSLVIMVMSMHDEKVYAERVLRAGARGYVMKTEGGEKLLEAIRCVLGGRVYVSERMTAAIMDGLAHQRSRADGALAPLTDREFEVFQLLGQGLSTREISHRLKLSNPTIGTHRMHIRQKLMLQTGAELVRHAVQWAAAQHLV